MRPTTAKLSSLAQVSTLLCGLALACLCRPLSVSGLSSECASGVELEVVAFYNAKSGGQKGNKLAATLAEIIGPGFVHDLSELKSAHNICLAISQAQQHWAHPQRPFPKVNSLKSLTRQFILVAGGDGTWQWAQSSLATCKQQSGSSLVHQFPPLAVLPLGTGNDAARVTGWGSTFPLPRALAAVRGTGGRVSRTASLEQQLKQRLCHIASQSRPVNYDVWRVAYTPQGITPSQLKESGSRIPNALQVGAQDRSFLGHMSNYISFGTDATIINRFHTSREERPEYHTGRAANFAQYFFQSAHVALTPSKPVQRKLAVQYRPLNGHWNTLNIPQSHRTILISNLPNYALYDPWNSGQWKSSRRKRNQGQPQSFNDGQLEILSMHNTWTGGCAFLNICRNKRLAQAAEVLITIQSDEAVDSQIDGEAFQAVAGTIRIRMATQIPILVNAAKKRSWVRKNEHGATVALNPVTPWRQPQQQRPWR